MVAVLHRHILLKAELGKAGLAWLQGIPAQHYALTYQLPAAVVEVELGVVFDGVGSISEHGELHIHLAGEDHGARPGHRVAPLDLRLVDA